MVNTIHMYKEYEVTIEEVGNGFVVQGRGAAWETRVALTLDEALALAKEVMLKPIPVPAATNALRGFPNGTPETI